MKLIALTAALLTLGTAVASADPYERGRHPYPEKRHNACQMKADQLQTFERRASNDGHIDRSERRTIERLRNELRTVCHGYHR
jgi:uncharacterized membrane protein YebE (DUF533 family)